MPTREQLTNERLQALIGLLEAKGIITEQEAQTMEATRTLGEGPAIAEAAREGRAIGPAAEAARNGRAEE